MTNIKLRFFAFLLAALALLPLGARAFCFGTPPPLPIYEYVNDVTEHYVLAGDSAEAGLNARSGKGRWHRTGAVFVGATSDPCRPFALPPAASLCGFYAPSIDAYFQTARSSECDGLRAHPESGWIGGIGGFAVYVPEGQCPGGSRAIRRYYSGASSASGVSHRHTSDPNVAFWLLARGWIDEGVDFCSNDTLLAVRQNIYEYVNDATGHFVLLWDPDEIGGIEAGSARTGWHFTGFVFGGFNVRGAIVPGAPLCRFYAPSINAHFLTARGVECDGLRAVPESGWIYERNDVFVQIPDVPGQCEFGLTPVYRLHSNTPTAGGVGYRHTADASIHAALLAQGWTDEGIAFCAASYSSPR